eukprot:TRINITY_DN4447_c0_g1_i1.p2 TRINITY_DN4447_c0_g1~~TRINITY_DN4447_c0_g1_i1.p2  ORF type:complete len:240 (-),score=45.14 TRINITY_DN4447_c0_g1_i1:257-976(-)
MVPIVAWLLLVNVSPIQSVRPTTAAELQSSHGNAMQAALMQNGTKCDMGKFASCCSEIDTETGSSICAPSKDGVNRDPCEGNGPCASTSLMQKGTKCDMGKFASCCSEIDTETGSSICAPSKDGVNRDPCEGNGPCASTSLMQKGTKCDMGKFASCCSEIDTETGSSICAPSKDGVNRDPCEGNGPCASTSLMQKGTKCDMGKFASCCSETDTETGSSICAPSKDGENRDPCEGNGPCA